MSVTLDELTSALIDPHCLTDEELIDHVQTCCTTSPRERELAHRLERALEELDRISPRRTNTVDPRQLTLPL